MKTKKSTLRTHNPTVTLTKRITDQDRIEWVKKNASTLIELLSTGCCPDENIATIDSQIKMESANKN